MSQQDGRKKSIFLHPAVKAEIQSDTSYLQFCLIYHYLLWSPLYQIILTVSLPATSISQWAAHKNHMKDDSEKTVYG